MKLAKPIIFFLIINFGGLVFGSWLMNNGPQTEWYQALNKAPWTPPGWVFGAAWTTIMICFSIYLGYLFLKSSICFASVFKCDLELCVFQSTLSVCRLSGYFCFNSCHFYVFLQ